MKYSTDFPIIFKKDGTMSLDMSRTITGPVVVLQRFLAKVLAKIGDYWWTPRVGTGLALQKGQLFDATRLATFEALVSLQASSDPQIDGQDVKILFVNGILTLNAWISVGSEVFVPSIVITQDGVTVSVGANQ